MRRQTIGICVACAATALIGCSDEYTAPPLTEPAPEIPFQAGEDGELKFWLSQFEPGISVELESRISVGTEFELTTANAQDVEEEIEIVSATSSDTDVLEVEQVGSDVLALSAMEPGKASLHVAATMEDGTELEDKYHFEVVEPASVVLSGCRRTQSKELIFTKGQAVIGLEARDEDGERLAAYGAVLFSMDVDEALEVENQADSPRQLRLLAGDVPAMVTLETDYGDDELPVEIVDRGEIDEIIITDHFFDSTLHIDPDDDRLREDRRVPFSPGVDGLRPCSATDIDFDVEVADEEICDVRSTPAGERPRSNHSLLITAKSAGTCEITIGLPEADGGQGIDKTITLEVEESSLAFPSATSH